MNHPKKIRPPSLFLGFQCGEQNLSLDVSDQKVHWLSQPIVKVMIMAVIIRLDERRAIFQKIGFQKIFYGLYFDSSNLQSY